MAPRKSRMDIILDELEKVFREYRKLCRTGTQPARRFLLTGMIDGLCEAFEQEIRQLVGEHKNLVAAANEVLSRIEKVREINAVNDPRARKVVFFVRSLSRTIH